MTHARMGRAAALLMVLALLAPWGVWAQEGVYLFGGWNNDVPTVTVVETSEYVQAVVINCDVTGSGPVNPVVTLFVRVAWGSFITAPVLAVV